MKKRLKEVMEQAKTINAEIRQSMIRNTELKNSLDNANFELSMTRNIWLMKLSDMDKDELKEYGTNESIREAKFKKENEEQLSIIKTVQDRLKINNDNLSLNTHDINDLKFE
ncbi:MAG TPA: hypothetical protein DEG71_05795, partial [Clostridiales bacterium]|nr:hypothetical protein [Clostridiales bacterium]